MPDLELGLVRDVTTIAVAIQRLAEWAIDTTQEIASLRDEVARHHRGIEALAERLDGVAEKLGAVEFLTAEDRRDAFQRYATLGDVDSLRAEMLSRTATPFDA